MPTGFRGRGETGSEAAGGRRVNTRDFFVSVNPSPVPYGRWMLCCCRVGRGRASLAVEGAAVGEESGWLLEREANSCGRGQIWRLDNGALAEQSMHASKRRGLGWAGTVQ